MRKLFSIFAALLFAGSIMAASFTITFKDSETDSDSSTKVTTVDDIIAEGADYVSSITTATNVYNARTGRGIKLGTSKATGSLVIALDQEYEVTSIVVNALQYSSTEQTLIIQDKDDYTIGSPAADYTYTYATATKISSITLGTKSKRNYLISVTVNYKSDEPSIDAANAVDFGTLIAGETAEAKTLSVEGANLTDAITYSLSDGTNFSVSGTLTATGGNLSISCTATAEGTYLDNLRLVSGTAAKEISISANVVSVSGAGTETDPYTVEDAIKLRGLAPGKKWVVGYILGGMKSDGTAIDNTVNTSLALAGNAEETDLAAVIAVQLSAGDARTALNVKDTPANIGKKVKVQGTLEDYLSHAGVKGVTESTDYAFIDEATTTYYLKNNWEAGEWTWAEMTKVADDQYKLENVVFGGAGVNWNTAESDEGASWVALEDFTGDAIKALDTVTLTLTPSTGVIYAQLLGSYVAPATNTYTVAGSNVTLFGTTWDETNTANDMTLKEGTTFEIVYTDIELAAGTVEFKVCVNHAWTQAYPASNYILTIPEGGIYTVTITYDSSTNAVSATAVKTGDAVVLPSVVMHGTFASTDWADTDPFTAAADELTATLTITLEAKDVEFGVKIDGAWTANGATITRDANTTDLTSGSGNMHLTADVAGDYTFTYTYATKTLAVTFPEAPVEGCDWDNIDFLGDGLGGGEYSNQFKVCAAEGQTVVNIQKPSWDAEGGIYTNFPAGISTVSLADGLYTIDGAGVVLHLAAFAAMYTDVTVTAGDVNYEFTVYNAKGTATAIVNNTVEEKAVKFIENGQLFIRKNGKTYNATGAVVK